MQSSKTIPPVELGRQLRKLIIETRERTGRSDRHLSKAIGKSGNYIASYLSNSPETWAIPKHPAFGQLLLELEITQSVLEELARAERTATQSCAKNNDPAMSDAP